MLSSDQIDESYDNK